ncbi:MAG TPA: BrnT family toxin [Rhodothermia bacterium]|nr:BrnT family toxin [Rhodothermia bacterium]
MDFEWDERKAALNEQRHGVDFRRASLVFDGRDVVFKESPRKGEMRWIATARLGDDLWSVVYTRREGSIRIISARRARKNEKERYYRSLLGRGD